MQQALSKVQSLADAHESLATGQQPTAIPTEAAAAPKSAKKGKAGKGAAAPAPAAAGSAVPLTGVALHKAERAVRASIEAVYGLFGALQGVMDSASYLQVMITICVLLMVFLEWIVPLVSKFACCVYVFSTLIGSGLLHCASLQLARLRNWNVCIYGQ